MIKNKIKGKCVICSEKPFSLINRKIYCRICHFKRKNGYEYKELKEIYGKNKNTKK